VYAKIVIFASLTYLFVSMHVFFLSEGFGINTNILETNILNLSVVIVVLVVFGGDVISSILTRRRERIVQSVQSAEEKYKEAQAALQKANMRLDEAKQKALTIRSQGDSTVQQVIDVVTRVASEELVRLEEVKNSTFALAEQKVTKQLQQELVSLTVTKAFTKMSTFLKRTGAQKKIYSQKYAEYVDFIDFAMRSSK
jgi:F-type H+-transporting ATPase subunit b